MIKKDLLLIPGSNQLSIKILMNINLSEKLKYLMQVALPVFVY